MSRRRFASDEERRAHKLAYGAAYREAHREKANAYQKTYMKSPEARARSNATALANYHADPAKHLARQRWHKYRLTPEAYASMLAAQGGCCAICHKAPRTDKVLHVDHCHETGKVRGLLCHTCNLRVGFYEHKLARATHAYLSTHASAHAAPFRRRSVSFKLKGTGHE